MQSGRDAVLSAHGTDTIQDGDGADLVTVVWKAFVKSAAVNLKRTIVIKTGTDRVYLLLFLYYTEINSVDGKRDVRNDP